MVIKKLKKAGVKALCKIIALGLVLSFVSYTVNEKLGLNGIENLSVFETENIKDAVDSAVNVDYIQADIEKDTAVLKLFGVIPVKKITVNKISTDSICLGGTPFGIKIFTKGVIVVGLTDIMTAKGAVCPAEDAGIQKGDIIISVNDVEVKSAEQFGKILSEQKDKSSSLKLIRDEKELSATIRLAVSSQDNKYKAGLWVRDSTAGIGTVTFVDKNTGIFGGLGHGVCDVDTGRLMPLDRGNVVDVTVTGVQKGEPHNPGELKGTFFRQNKGNLSINTQTGVFGKYTTPDAFEGETVKIGSKDQVTEGKIQIYTTISGTTPQKYDAEIVKIVKESTNTKNFMIKVTDKELLEKTGGIVQGMSGSPILQDGKLIGAVTHVLINNPEKGYGIFIENMLESANALLNEEASQNHMQNAA